MKKLLILVLPFLVFGCCSTVAKQETAYFQCGTETIKVKLLSKKDAVLTFRGEKHILHRQKSSSTIYENIGQSIVFWREGDHNYFKTRQEIYPACEMIKKVEVEITENY